MKLNGRLGCRLFAILCMLVLVLLIQIITVSRLSSVNNGYPWERDEQRTADWITEEYRREVRNPLEKDPPIKLEEQISKPDVVLEKPSLEDKFENQKTTLSNTKPNTQTRTHSDVPSPESSLEPSSRPATCEPKGKDALSALERAKTSECRQKILDTICLSQDDKLYNVSLQNECPIGRNPAKQFKFVPYSEGKGPAIRIVFLLSIHGRAVREVKRLFKTIYHSDHYYYIHVDFHSDYLYQELKLAFKDYSNVYFPGWRMATIWGGASLLQMLLKALEELEYDLTHWKWDFFINLSESDFPLKTIDELVQFLRVHRDSNFVKTHGGDIKKFIQKQGLDRTFVECDYHMWRIGNRPLPKDITIDGGSDWIVINRNYSHYLITNQGPYVTGLKKYYEFSLLPAESFFHTVLRNGPMCDTLVRSNLRITNWNRKLGCRCQYKHIVDWCGCSPNDFLNKDLDRIKNPKDDQFFARKFEAIVNQHVINELDAHLHGTYPSDTPGLNSYWESLYSHKFDPKPSSNAHYTVYHSFLRTTLAHVSKKFENGAGDCVVDCDQLLVSEVFVHYQDDKFVGYVTKFETTYTAAEGKGPESLVLESLYTLSDSEIKGETETCPKLRSASVEVGSNWDGKESIFRNYGGILGINNQPTVAVRMLIGRMCHVDVSWINPLGIMEQKTELKLEAGATVNVQKLNAESPIMPGKWTVRITSSNDLFIEKQFIVFPLMFDETGKLLSEPSLLNAKRITILKPGMNAEKYMDWRINILKEGGELEEWIDKLVSSTWSLQSTCLYSRSNTACNNAILPNCESSSWSSYYPDTKSELGQVNSNGRLR